MHETQTQLKQTLYLGHLQGPFSHVAVLVLDDVGYHSEAFPTVKGIYSICILYPFVYFQGIC